MPKRRSECACWCASPILRSNIGTYGAGSAPAGAYGSRVKEITRGRNFTIRNTRTTPAEPTWDGRGVHQTLFDEQVVSTDTRHTLSTAAKAQDAVSARRRSWKARARLVWKGRCRARACTCLNCGCTRCIALRQSQTSDTKIRKHRRFLLCPQAGEERTEPC